MADGSPIAKTRKKRSWLWAHYNELDGLLAECNECKSRISFKDGTNKMKGHLQKEHRIFNRDDPSKKIKVVCSQQDQIESALVCFIYPPSHLHYHFASLTISNLPRLFFSQIVTSLCKQLRAILFIICSPSRILRSKCHPVLH